MPNEEMLRIERDAMRLVLSCCGGVAGNQCDEGAGQILMQSLSVGGAEAGMCLDVGQVGNLGRALHEMMLRILPATTFKERVPHYKREILILEDRLARLRKGLEACEGLAEVEDATRN